MSESKKHLLKLKLRQEEDRRLSIRSGTNSTTLTHPIHHTIIITPTITSIVDLQKMMVS